MNQLINVVLVGNNASMRDQKIPGRKWSCLDAKKKECGSTEFHDRPRLT
jgi:hypothetical protein